VQSDGNRGFFQNHFAVYGRDGERCPGCVCDVAKTGGIKRFAQNGRSSFYCPASRCEDCQSRFVALGSIHDKSTKTSSHGLRRRHSYDICGVGRFQHQQEPNALDGGSTTVPQFAKVIDDLPLMPGLVPQEDKDVLFIAGPGRIAETTAKGSVDIDEVYHFYQHSLPQLGWKEVNARTYERGNEHLRIDVSGANPSGITVVRFSVEPIAKSK